MNEKIALALLLAFVLSALFGRLLIPLLKTLKFGQSIRGCGPEMHLKKAGTPTMGGLMIIPAVLLSSVVFADHDSDLLLALFIFIGYAFIGFLDDYIKIILKRNLGLTAKQKLFGQMLIAAAFIFFAYTINFSTAILIPGLGNVVQLDNFYYVLVFFLMIGTTNSVNLTDGLDGLAAGATVPVAIAYILITIMSGLTSLSIFATSIIGACFGFLIYNMKPAQVFMGDTGSLALGGAVAALAVLSKAELFLIIIGGLYVLEALSVIIQVASFKLRDKRVFLMSPVHHHFELKGWDEAKVVYVFWLVACLFSAAGFLLWMRS